MTPREIEARLKGLNIAPGEIVEKFIRSSSPGGQNVNKLATCVYLKHIPTGITVKCQKERHQARNRALAYQLLLDKIHHSRLALERQETAKRARHLRETRKRPAEIKESILAGKRRHAEKKSARRKISAPHIDES